MTQGIILLNYYAQLCIAIAMLGQGRIKMKIKTAAIAASAAMAVPTVAAHAGELNLICSADVVICEKLVAAFEAGRS